MGNLIVTQFITVDGVAEDPGGSEKMERGGWAFEFNRGEDGDRFKLDEVMAADALLLGRTTYEGFAAAWPEREGEFADKFNNMAKYVVSSTLSAPDWNNSHVIGTGDVARIKGEVDGDILVNGSMQLLPAIAEHVDEWRLMVFPVVLGQGKKLFGDDGPKVPLALRESRPVGDEGVVILTYRPKA